MMVSRTVLGCSKKLHSSVRKLTFLILTQVMYYDGAVDLFWFTKYSIHKYHKLTFTSQTYPFVYARPPWPFVVTFHLPRFPYNNLMNDNMKYFIISFTSHPFGEPIRPTRSWHYYTFLSILHSLVPYLTILVRAFEPCAQLLQPSSQLYCNWIQFFNKRTNLVFIYLLCGCSL